MRCGTVRYDSSLGYGTSTSTRTSYSASNLARDPRVERRIQLRTTHGAATDTTTTNRYECECERDTSPQYWYTPSGGEPHQERKRERERGSVYVCVREKESIKAVE
mmetsp:Transcript_5391/g.12582  ORF Transcript_5391/g.12582 Transcript_5391/m.12582 type:complete len:106 (+) Transcript_5391:152-469(+)